MRVVEKEVRIYRVEGDELIAIIESLKEILYSISEIYESSHDTETREVVEKDTDF